jgi:integrase
LKVKPEAEASYAYLSMVGSAVENLELCRTILQNGGSAPMARPRNLIPTYRKHSSGRAAVTVYRTDGSRAEVLLPGCYGSDESKQEYERILAQLRANQGIVPDQRPAPSDFTVTELVHRFMAEHVEYHYRRPDGTQTGEKANWIMTIRPLVRLFGSKPASEFTPLDLRAIRDAFITGSWMTDDEKVKRRKTRGGDGTTGRKETNKRIGRIKKLFKWGAEMMLVSPIVWHGLQTVSGLQAGRGAARESKDIEPVPLEHVEMILPHLPEVFADIVRVQMYSGARAGEILKMRTCDVDNSVEADVWIYTPSSHKNEWRGHRRKIVFGPRARLVLTKYLSPAAPEAFLFRPGMGRPRKQGKLRPRYDVCELDKAIARACVKANVPHWSSHQLRHLAARLAEKEISIEAARAYLGHKSIALTTHYSGIDLNAAAGVARRIG